VLDTARSLSSDASAQENELRDICGNKCFARGSSLHCSPKPIGFSRSSGWKRHPTTQWLLLEVVLARRRSGRTYNSSHDQRARSLMLQYRDCRAGAEHAKSDFEWWIVRWPLKSGRDSYSDEGAVDECAESSPEENVCDQQCHDIAHEVLRIEAALRSHQIDSVKTEIGRASCRERG
jgi:hypothetical protein